MNNKKIKTMKSKSIIGAALVAIFTLGTTTSCEDMFDIESSRVVYEKNHNLNNTADSIQHWEYSSVCNRLPTATSSSERYVATW